MPTDSEKYLTEAEQEILLLTDLFETKFLSGEILDDENGRALLKTLRNMRAAFRKKIENEKNSEQWKIKHEKEKYNNINKICEHCGQTRPLTVVGEGRNTDGHRVHQYKCNHCRQLFFDLIPFEDEHYVAFLEKFIQQYLAGEQQGILLAKKLHITKNNFQNVKTNLDNFKLAIKKEHEADQLLKTLAKESEKNTKNMIENLYHLYGKILAHNPTKPD